MEQTMPSEYRRMEDAETRLASTEPLTADEARALFRWVVPLHHALPRIQMDLALQQIIEIRNFNSASTKLAVTAICAAVAQVIVGGVALVIALRK
jgi:hypothetical protein